MGLIARSPEGHRREQGGAGETGGTEELSEQETLGTGVVERETLGFAIGGQAEGELPVIIHYFSK